MTVSANDRRREYSGNGVTTVFNGPMAYQASHILAYLVDDVTGVPVQQPGAAFTVTFLGREAGSTVTMNTAPPVGQTLLLLREVPEAQLVDITNQGSFNASIIERQADLLAMQIQQVADSVEHKIGVPDTTIGVNTMLPTPVPNVLWGWDDTSLQARYFTLSDLANFIAYGDKTYQVFTGNGATTTFPLGQDPGSLGNLDVSIDGITQVNGTEFTYSGTTLTFTTAPPNLSTILVRYDQAVPVGTGLSSAIQFQQSGTGTVVRSSQEKMREVLNARDFTGVLGDGSNDDTAGLQLAINEASASGRDLELGRGTFIVTTLTGLSNVAMVGDGRGRTVIRRKASASGNTSIIDFSGKTGFTLRGITFDGNKASQSNAAHSCTIFNCSDFVIDDCAFINSKAVASAFGAGIAIVNCDGSSSASRVMNCDLISNDTHGLYVTKSSGLIIESNQSDFNGGGGIELSDLTQPPTDHAQSNIVVADNLCRNNAGNGITAGGYYVGAGGGGAPIYGPSAASSFITITGNVCSGNDVYGIAWQGAYGAVVGNTCFSNGATGSGAGILFNGLASTCTGNSCFGNLFYGIDSGGSFHSIINANQCHSNVSTGINLGATVDCECSDNQIVLAASGAGSGITMPGIDGDGTTPFPTVGNGTTIENNRIVMNADANSVGVFISRNYHNATVRNNKVSNSGVVNRAFIMEVESITVSGNEDTYLYQVAGQQIAGVTSASNMVIPDHIELATVAGNTNISTMRTYSQNVFDGKVRDIEMTNQGTGYTSAPAVNFSGGGGSGAAATAEVDNGGRVVGVTMTNNGSGYTSAPSISFVGGGGSAAAGTALVGCANANGRQIQLLFQGTLTVNDGGNLILAGNLSATPNAATLRLLGTYGGYYEIGRTSGM